jgi:hypothetical protein
MSRTLLTASLFLAPLLFASALSAEIPDPFPADPREYTETFVTVGLQELLPGIGYRHRDRGKSEYTLHVGLLPTSQSLDAGMNFFADNPEPNRRGTWYWGPGLLYMHDDSKAGKFHIGHIYAVAGREKRITEALRWNWEAGLAAMVFYSYKGGGPPILFPILPMLRLEMLYRVI